MNNKDFEARYGGVPDFTENNKFIEMVQKIHPKLLLFQ